ncbi:hypothetical protein [Candidatus Methylacidiphilum infernorum]|uniref:Methyl-accepting chemotaxis protein n=1 Tax=Methylacidiphilum infernorum (isolate V4) TaxID=481448 RepID=B3E1C5_METI4|nr:hypothetical protein [Candidatus Methylacidiphilum infernorum]ACD82921.1 Conserved hypothetical protein [Methylacidiphilum infernorum V4]
MEEKLEETLRKLAAGQERLENKTEILAAAVEELSAKTERRFEDMASAVRELTRAVGELAERQANTDRMIGELTRVVRELSEHAARTDMRLERIEKRLEDIHLVATLISIDQRAGNSKLDLVVETIDDLISLSSCSRLS